MWLHISFYVQAVESWTFLVQQQNLGQRFGTSKMHLSPTMAWAAVRFKAVVLLLLTFCLLLLPLLESVIALCFVVRYFMSILVLQSSWWGRESWLLCLICLPDVSWWLSGSYSRCHGVFCGLCLWYILIILTIFANCFAFRLGFKNRLSENLWFLLEVQCV